jgi:hypothetical protein
MNILESGTLGGLNATELGCTPTTLGEKESLNE